MDKAERGSLTCVFGVEAALGVSAFCDRISNSVFGHNRHADSATPARHAAFGRPSGPVLGSSCKLGGLMSSLHVSALFVYPIKSCRGIALEAMQLGERGPLWDREWMVVDAQGTFLSQ